MFLNVQDGRQSQTSFHSKQDSTWEFQRQPVVEASYKTNTSIPEYLFTSAGTWGWLHRRRQPGSQGLVALDERFVAPRLRQPLVQVPRLLRGRSQRRSPERWEMRKSPRWVIKERILYGDLGTKSYLGLASSYQTFDIWIHRKVSMSPLDRPELRSASSSKPKLPENSFVSMHFWRKSLNGFN